MNIGTGGRRGQPDVYNKAKQWSLQVQEEGEEEGGKAETLRRGDVEEGEGK